MTTWSGICSNDCWSATTRRPWPRWLLCGAAAPTWSGPGLHLLSHWRSFMDAGCGTRVAGASRPRTWNTPWSHSVGTSSRFAWGRSGIPGVPAHTLRIGEGGGERWRPGTAQLPRDRLTAGTNDEPRLNLRRRQSVTAAGARRPIRRAYASLHPTDLSHAAGLPTGFPVVPRSIWHANGTASSTRTSLKGTGPRSVGLIRRQLATMAGQPTVPVRVCFAVPPLALAPLLDCAVDKSEFRLPVSDENSP